MDRDRFYGVTIITNRLTPAMSQEMNYNFPYVNTYNMETNNHQLFNNEEDVHFQIDRNVDNKSHDTYR